MSTQNSNNILSLIEQEQLNNFLGPVNGALGGLSVAEKNQSYFVVFTGAGGTGPEIIDQTALFITYLVDENGNVSKPSEDYDSLNNLIQNFEVGKNVVVRNDAPTALNGNIAGVNLTTAIGRQQPILYTQTGSSAGANITTLSFDGELNQNGLAIMEGLITVQSPGLIGTPGNFQNLTGWIEQILPDPSAASFDTVAGKYVINTSGIGTTQNITLRFAAEFLWDIFDQNFPSVDVSLIRLTPSLEVVATKSYTLFNENEIFNTGNDPLEFTIGGSDLDGDPEYYIAVVIDPAITIQSAQFQAINQNPTPGNVSVTSFWENNSYNNLWLTASSELSSNYGRIPSPVQECLDFNFSPIETPFNVQVGDRIRFEYNPNTEYFIYEVIEPVDDNEGLLRLRLNTLIPDSVNLDNFVLHRVNTNDPAYIILDVKKNNLVGNTQNFNGVILPEYPTKRLKDNLDNILLDLKSRGIITDNEN